MLAIVVDKESDWVLNHCAKYLARDNIDDRHSFFGLDAGLPRARISESWRFPIVDADDSGDKDASEHNHVTFVYRGRDVTVRLLTPCLGLHMPTALKPVGDSDYLSLTIRVPRGRRHRYRFIVGNQAQLDPINPQVMTTPQNESWSCFWTWTYNEPINLERWEMALIGRMTSALLPFQGRETRNLIERGLNDGNVAHFFRLDIPVGVANYIDNILAREERHHLHSYKLCLPMIYRVIKRRYPNIEPADVNDPSYKKLFDDMKSNSPDLAKDGWDLSTYGNPGYFLYILRRHTWTGAFSHPKYGGNPGGLGWAFLGETYRTTADPTVSAFDWARAIEKPLGSSGEYRG
ncbi:hypothetical protein [Bradyrhizobium sp. LMG 9283]|uniref:hypothetical protein n=1 Tax=Bradyrhizobium sp. LMG 9283 TaxID=592064 RepID=UPI00388E6953